MPATAAGGSSGPDVPRRLALAALCVTVTVSYGVIYYAFPVLASQIASATGWSRAAVTVAYSAGNLAGALAGIPAGRILGRRGPRLVMTTAALTAAVAIAGLAAAPGFAWFLAAWLLAGLSSAGLFYPPAFAALTAWYGERRVQAVTTLTLVAGFASTIFAPLTSALDSGLGWRGTYLVLAAVLAIAVIPAHAVFLRLPWTPQARASSAGKPGADRKTGERGITAGRTFLFLAAAAALCSFVQYAVLVNLVPLLTGRGLAPGLAAWALGLGGAGQVAGRLCYRFLHDRVSPRGRAVTVVAATGAATLLLGVLPGPAALLIAASVAAGVIRGLFTLTQATLVADYWGTARYAAVNGAFNAPITAAGALAPGIGAGIAAATGYPVLFAVLALTAVGGAALAAAAPSPVPDARPLSGSGPQTRGELADPAG